MCCGRFSKLGFWYSEAETSAARPTSWQSPAAPWSGIVFRSGRLASITFAAATQPGASRSRRSRRLRDQVARGLPSEIRKIYVRSRYWQKWTRARSPRSPSNATNTNQREPLDPKTAPLAESVSSTRRSLIVRSAAMRRLTAELDSLRYTDVPILIQGETGAGKEYIARIIHVESSRCSGPFEIVSCATIPPELLEAEMFGALAGSFTGSEFDRTGLLERASGGTVLLDDISGLNLEAQAKLLRVLSSSSVRPLGAEKERIVDVRFLFSSSTDLSRDVECGRLREDLFHRICVVPITVPPLRERPEDVPELIRCILSELTDDSHRAAFDVAGEAIHELQRREWPGNVRELRNLLIRLRVENSGKIDAAALRRSGGELESNRLFSGNVLEGRSLDELKHRLERDFIVYHFERLGNDTQALSRVLGVRAPAALSKVSAPGNLTSCPARAARPSG